MIRQNLRMGSHVGVSFKTRQDTRVFVSTYEGAIDAKGRISIPAPFRAALGGGQRVFLWVALDGSGSLEGGGEDLMAMYRDVLALLPPQSEARDALVSCIIAGSADLKIDETGRIKLPDDLCAAASLADRIKFSGQMDSFRIWNPQAHARHLANMRAAAAKPETIGALAEAYNEARRRRGGGA